MTGPERIGIDVIRRGRLAGSRGGDVAAFLSSMEADRNIARADLIVDMAHLLMLIRQGLIDRHAAGTLMEALLTMFREGVPEEAFNERFEDIHAGIEAYLISRAGEETGGRLHTARSRNDEVATCIRIRLREDILLAVDGLTRMRQSLLGISRRNTCTLMPGFTHLQYAQPVTLAHHLVAYESAFARDTERFQELYRRVNRSPLGAGALAATTYPIDREYTAALLGFDQVIGNSMDAVASRDFILETLFTATVLLTTVSRLCEELVLWSAPFCAFIELDNEFCSTSSIMPQKKNPDTAEILRAKTGTVAGSAVAATAILKGLPMSYNRDLQEINPHLWRGMADTLFGIRLLERMVTSARFFPERLLEEAGKGGTTTTDLADMLVRRFDLPFRTAHSIVGRAVALGGPTPANMDTAGREITGQDLSSRGLTPIDIKTALDPVRSVEGRKVTGGPSPDEVERQIMVADRNLEENIQWLERMTETLQKAETRLIAEAEEAAAV